MTAAESWNFAKACR